MCEKVIFEGRIANQPQRKSLRWICNPAPSEYFSHNLFLCYNTF